MPLLLRQPEDRSRESSDPYYDLIDDFDLVISSFQTQYGIRLSRELHDMKWDEFCDLLSGLGAETPLGRIIAIRSEGNKDVLKNFSKEQHRVRNEWRRRSAKQVTADEMNVVLEQMKQALMGLAGE